MKTLVKILFLATATLTIASCGSSDGGAKPKIVNLSGENDNMNSNTLVFDSANPTNFYSRIDSISQYGYGYSGDLETGLQNKKVKVVLTGKMRVSDVTDGGIVVSLIANDKAMHWDLFSAAKYITANNTWTTFSDSITIPETETMEPNSVFKIYPLKGKTKGTLETDSLYITIKEDLN